MDSVIKIQDLLSNFTIYPASEVFVAENNGDDFYIYQIYRINAVSETSSYYKL